MNDRRRFVCAMGSFVALSGRAFQSRADSIGYAAVVDCQAQSDRLLVEHHHDWSESTRGARWQMISTDGNVFSPANQYAWLRVSDRQSGERLFHSPAPALTHLWISADSEFIVGLSNIKLWNPVQLVVFSVRGERLLAQGLLTLRGGTRRGGPRRWGRRIAQPGLAARASGCNAAQRLGGPRPPG